jgi:uncharacterized protein
MSIALTCPACHAAFEAPGDLPADVTPCPQCAAPVPLPATLVALTAVIETPGKPATAPRVWVAGTARPLLKEEKTFALTAHLAALLVGFLVTPLCGFVAPLILLVFKGKESRFVAHHARESLNYQIMVGVLSVFFGGTFAVLLIVGLVLGFTLESKAIVIGYFAVLGGAGLLSVLLELYAIFMVILACTKAYQGEWFRYPFCIRWVREL